MIPIVDAVERSRLCQITLPGGAFVADARLEVIRIRSQVLHTGTARGDIVTQAWIVVFVMSQREIFVRIEAVRYFRTGPTWTIVNKRFSSNMISRTNESHELMIDLAERDASRRMSGMTAAIAG